MKRFGYALMCFSLLQVTLVSAGERAYFLPAPSVQTYGVILAGASPDKAYGDQIRSWSLKLYDVLTQDYGHPRDHIILLMSGADAKKEPRISGPGDRDSVVKSMKTLEGQLRSGDQLFFFLIGHGTSDAEAAKFVLTGPDLSSGDFADMLKAFPSQDIVVVNTASSSFPFCADLTGPGRVLVSATRSRAEKYDTVFAQYFIAALENHAADRDKNRRVSIWEAFVFAVHHVEKWYEDQDRIPTEHALLEDNGDGIFSRDTGPGQEDGVIAQIAFLDALYASQASDNKLSAGDTRLNQTLTAKIRELERSVFLLRHRKADLPQETYQQEMEKLLIELARASRRLRRLSGE